MKVATKGYVLAKGEESVAPAGFAPPPHVHHAEDEAFYVLEGDVTFTCGDRTWNATAGSFAFLPRDVPHQFQVSDDGPHRPAAQLAPADAAGTVRPVRRRGRRERAGEHVACADRAGRSEAARGFGEVQDRDHATAVTRILALTDIINVP